MAKATNVTEQSAINFAEKVRSGDIVLKEGQTMLQGYTAWMKSTGQASQAASIKMNLFTLATKAISTIGWTVALSLAFKLLSELGAAIDRAVHKEKYMLEAAEEANKAIKELNDTYEDHSDLVEEVADSYEELSKGVDAATNKNINLSTEDYEKYLEINQKLAEAFPELVSTMDTNGNAILRLGDNGKTAAEGLREALKAEEDLNNYKISQNIEDVFGGIVVKQKAAEKAVENYSVSLEGVNAVLEDLALLEKSDYQVGNIIQFSGKMSDQGDIAKLEAYQTAIKEFYTSLSLEERTNLNFDPDTSYLISGDGENTIYDFYLDLTQLTVDQKKKLSDALHTQAKQVAGDLMDSAGDIQKETEMAQKEAQMAWTDFLPNMVATMKSMASFDEYLDHDEDLQNFAIQLVNGLDPSEWPEIDEQGVETYIRNNIIIPLNELSSEERKTVIDAYQSLLALDVDDMNPEELKKQVDAYVNQIAALLNKDPITLKVQLGFGTVDETEQRYEEVAKKAAEKDSGRTSLDYAKGRPGSDEYKNSYDDITEFMDDNGINTIEEINRLDQLIDKYGDLEQAKREYLNLSFDGEDASFTSVIAKVQKLSEGFDQIDAIYADVYDKGDFDWSSIVNNDSFANTFGNMTDVTEEYKSAYNDFIRTVSNSPDDINACQNAFDNLATAYLYNSGVLDDLTEETKSATVAQLEQMGVSNAEEVVTAALAERYGELAFQKWQANNASYDFIHATADDINNLDLEGQYADIVRQKIALYTLQKKLSNQTTIYTDGDIENLIALAATAGASADMVNEFKNSLNNVNVNSRYYTNDPDRVQARYNRIYSNLAASLKEASVAQVKYNGGAKTAAARQNSAADATNKLTDALKKQKEELEAAKQEWEDLYDAVSWFYDKQSDGIDKQIDKLNDANDALNKQKDTMDGILSVISEVYEKQIDAIQERIDALEDANDEEEKSLQLEKARQALEEARRKKNIRVYTKDRGYVWTVDNESIKSAEDDYNDLVDEMQKDEIKKALEDQIEAINKLKDAFADIPNAYERALNEAKAAKMLGSNWKMDILNPGDDLINSFKNTYIGIQGKIDKNESKISSLEEEKQHIEDLKQLWEDAKNAYTESQYEAKLNSFFGSDYEHQLLNNSATWRAQFAKEYADVCAQIEEIEKKIKEAEESESSSSSSGGSGGSSSGGSGSSSGSGTDKTVGDVSKVLTDVDSAVDNSKQKISELETVMNNLISAKDQLLSAVGQSVNDVTDLIDDSATKMTALQGQVGILSNNITLVGEAIRRLLENLAKLDDTTFSQIINELSGSANGQTGQTGLIGALNAVIDKITGETGLIKQLNDINDKVSVTGLVNKFSSSDTLDDGTTSLLTAIQTVNNALFVDNDENCLYGKILKLEETTINVDNVAASFDTFKQKVSDCIKEIDELAKKISELADVEITVKYTVAEATGTATTPKGYATGTATSKPAKSGNAYSSGTGNWGLPADAPHSLLGEVGTELLVRNGNYFVIPKPQFVDLKKGDIVFNHEQTKAILNGGRASTLEQISRKADKVTPGILEKQGSSFANGTSPELNVSSLRQRMNDSTAIRGANLFGIPVSTQNTGNTTLQFNGDLSFPNIKSGDDAEKLIKELQNLPNRALQRVNRH